MPNLQSDFEYLIQNSPPNDPLLLSALVQAYGDYANRLVTALFYMEADNTLLEAIFLRVSQSLDNYLIGSNFKLWFTRIALKECNSLGRKRQRLTLKWPPTEREISDPFDTSDIETWWVLKTPKKKYFLPIVLRYSLNLTIDEISEVLRLREKKVLDLLDKGIQRLLLQANPAWGALSKGHMRAIEHREYRQHTYHSAWLSNDSEASYHSHLANCPQCRSHKGFTDKLERHLPLLLKPAAFPEETVLTKINHQAEKNYGNQLQSTRLRRPGQEIIWIIIGVALVLGIGWFFNRINPLIEVQQALQAQITPTMIAPLEPLSGEVHRISTPVVNTTQAGTATESSWNPRISGEGNQLVFASSIRHLVAEDNNAASDIFLYEMRTGGVERISISSTGEEGNNGSYEPSISRDGRLIVFTSWANNLTPQDKLNCEFWNTQSSCPDIFLHDRKFGTTTLVSRNSRLLPGDSFSFAPEISQDGNLIAFWSAASDLVPNDTDVCGSDSHRHNCIDLFLLDLSQISLTRVPIGRNYNEDLPSHYEISISADGELLLLTLDSTDRLGTELELENPLEVYLYHRATGLFEPVNQAADGTLGNESSYAGNISPDGRWIVWASLADNLAGADSNGFVDIFLRDRRDGTVDRISQSVEGGDLDGDSGIIGGREGWFGESLSVSDGGRFILFTSTANDLAPDQENYCGVTVGCRNVFLHDRLSGDTTQLNSTNIDFIPFTSLSADGTYGTYMAHSQNCNPAEFCLDIFVFNRVDGIIAQLGSYGVRTGSELPAAPPSPDKLTLNSHSRWVVGLVFSPDGEYLASGSRDQSVIVWSVLEEKQLSQMDGELVAFSPNSELLAAADDDGLIYLWRMPQGQLSGVLSNEVRARDLAFSPDGDILAVAGSKGVYLWDIEGRAPIQTLSIPTTVVRAVAISPDGQYLAAATDDHSVWILSLPDGFTVARLGGHEDKVVDVAFSPDGNYLASGSNDNTANLWRVRPGLEGSLDADRVYQFHHQDWVTSLTFSPDSGMLATGSFDNSVAFWDVSSGDLVTVPYRQTQNQVLSLAFSPDGDTFAAGNVRGEIHFWRSLQLVED